MYDPSLVKTFTKIYKRIAPSDAGLGEQDPLLPLSVSSRPREGVDARQGPLDKISSSTEENRTVYELAQALNGRKSLSDTGTTIAEHVRRLVPASVFVFYIYDSDNDELRARYTYGVHADSITGTRIPMGQRLSGWVAANSRTVVNSDPSLDLGDAARSLEPKLRSCLATPLRLPDELVGVLALYSNLKDAFTDDHRRVLEMVADQAAKTIQLSSRAATDGAPPLNTSEAGLPTLDDLTRLFSDEHSLRPSGRCFSLLLIVVDDGSSGIDRVDDPALERVFTQVTNGIRSSLRTSDLLFQAAPYEYLVLLPDTDAQKSLRLGDELRTKLGSLSPVEIGSATSPSDGTNLAQLQRAARGRLSQKQVWSEHPTGPRPSVH